MQPLLRSLRANCLALVCAIGALVFVGGWRLWAIANDPPHMLEIASEVGSIAQGREGIVPNRDGTHAVYNQETEGGVGVYLYDVASGQNRLLLDQRESGYGSPDNKCRMLDWSPDGNVVAYYVSMSYSSDPPPQTIVLYDGRSGQKLAEIPASAYAPGSQFVWLTTNSFLYSAYHQRSWLIFSRKDDGNWKESQVIKRFAVGRLANLVVTSPHSIAWRQTNTVWSYDFAGGGLKKIWDTTNRLNGFTYDDSGDFLFNCDDENDSYAVRFHPPEIWQTEGRTIKIDRNPSRDRYADFSMQHDKYTFNIKLNAVSDPVTFTWDGMLVNHALCGDSLFLMGNEAGSVPGIWQYDVASKELRCLESGLRNRMRYASLIPFTNELGTNSDGTELAYRLWSPAGVIPGKKYPVILGQIYGWTLDPLAAANEGYYVAVATMADWGDVRRWPEEIMALRDIVAKEPNIDTNRVFLIAYSAQSAYVERVLASAPDICTGLIFFHPVVFPDLSGASISKVLLIDGADDSWAPPEELAQYQNEIVKSGVAVDFILQNGVKHVNDSITTEREQAKALARFLAKK